jgi:4-amino-4-deoxy-L-arabinose transferase-like glycosyltransferase
MDGLELGRFLARRRSIWLALLVAALLVLSLVAWVVQTTAAAPYMYPLF